MTMIVRENGSEVSLAINRVDPMYAVDFIELDGQNIGGALVSIKPLPNAPGGANPGDHDVAFELSLKGSIQYVEIGGRSVFIDHICLQYAGSNDGGTGGTGGNNGSTGGDNGGTSGDTTQPMDPDAVAIYPDAASGAANDIVTVPFLVKNFEAISGVQGTLAWDTTVMELVTQANDTTGAEEVVVTDAAGYTKTLTVGGQTYEYDEPYFKSTNFTFVNDQTSGERIEGILTFLWNEADIPDIGRNVDDDDTLFALQFRLIGSAGEMGLVELVDDPTPYLVAPASGEDIDETTQAGEVSIINQIVVSGAVWMGGDSDLPVINVTVELEQNGSTSQEITDETGAFGYTLTDTSEIILRAEKADRSKPSRSVDVSDIVAMRKHILVIERLATVPAMIAADANEDDSIDVADIVAMQKVILAKSDSLSTDDKGNAQPP